jgi:bifunctional UDP-N-acetylglucosamine pyrophosphorylase / glucosamine-1-phosphate N-acetyltransferase
MSSVHNKKIAQLLSGGTRIPAPESVEIGDEVDPARISGNGVTLHAGCRIFGAHTWVSDNVQLGYEAPVTIDNCRLGPEVELRGGFFNSAVFLKGVQMGSGAHVRSGTILEEQSGGAHTVALKQTILFPFVILGSLINFCDCFMAGGTSRKNHSEVGSSYIHFNYTPNQDKATASMLGDVPRGVMLDQPPIFLGGQGGLVGPCRIEFGNIIAAGTIYRKDILNTGKLSMGSSGRAGSVPFNPGLYRSVKRVAANNIHYIANLIALLQWYRHVRSEFISINFPKELHQGLIQNLEAAIDERIKRLGDLAGKMPRSIALQTEGADTTRVSSGILQQKELNAQWPEVETFFSDDARGITGRTGKMELFLSGLTHGIQDKGIENYIAVIQGLDPALKQTGTEWLQGIVDGVTARVMEILPSFAAKG